MNRLVRALQLPRRVPSTLMHAAIWGLVLGILAVLAVPASSSAATVYRWTGFVKMTDSYVHEYYPGDADVSEQSFTSTIKHRGEEPILVDDGDGNFRARHENLPVLDVAGVVGDETSDDSTCPEKVTATSFSYPPVSTHVDVSVRPERVVYETFPQASTLLSWESLVQREGSGCESSSYTYSNFVRTDNASLELGYVKDAEGRIRVQTTFSQDPGTGSQFSAVTRTWEINLVGDPNPQPACADGQNNDFDGLADYPLDPGCTSADDTDELGTVQCDNGVDDDADGKVDWPTDGGCADALDNAEIDPRPCLPVRSALPGYVGHFPGRETEELRYDVDVRWCTDGELIKIVDVEVVAQTRADTKPSYLKSFERVLRSFVQMTVEWDETEPAWKDVPTAPGSRAIEVSGGRVEGCHGVFPGLGKLAALLRLPGIKQLFKLTKAARRPLVRLLAKRLKKEALDSLKKAARKEGKKYAKELQARGVPKKLAKRKGLARAKKIRRAREEELNDAIDAQVAPLIDGLLPAPFCHTLWTPRVRMNFTTAGAASWVEQGDIRGGSVPLFEVERVR